MDARRTSFRAYWSSRHELSLVLLLWPWWVGPCVAWPSPVVVGWSPSILAHILRHVLLLPVLPLVVSGEPSVGVVMVVAIIVKMVVIVPIIFIMATVFIVPAIVITLEIVTSVTIVVAWPVVIIAIIVIFPIAVVVPIPITGRGLSLSL